MRLVDADEVKKALTGWDTDPTDEEIEYTIDHLPTIEATPVVHGRWEETLVPDGYVQKASRVRKKCSACGWSNACRYKYCPNCGAKMDGGDTP